MDFFVLLVVVVIVVPIVVAAAKRFLPAASTQTRLHLAARPELFSPAERSFLGVLDQALAGEYRIFGKVRLGDLVEPAKGQTWGQSTIARNKLNRKHVDFVLCRPDTLAVVAAIELDDSSHARKDRAERDDFVNRALAAAGIPVVHFPVRKAYSLPEVQAKLTAALTPAPVRKQGTILVGKSPLSKGASNDDRVAMDEANRELFAAKPETENPPNCPACNVPMVKRQAQKGPNAGQWFWACSGYPKCRKIIAVG